jgi:hypothetical protein
VQTRREKGQEVLPLEGLARAVAVLLDR